MSNPSRTAPPKDSIGGTTATQILGLNKYGGKHAAYRKLVRGLEGLPDETPVNFQMYRGMIAEAPIVELIKDEFLEETGLFMGELFGSGVIRHGDYPFIHATVDRLLVNQDGMYAGILEVKTVGLIPGNDRYWWRHEAGSPQHLCQVEHYVEVIESALPDSVTEGGLKENYLLVAEADPETWSMAVRLINDGHSLDGIRPLIDIRWVRCSFDGDYRERRLKDLVSFWTKHIEPRIPPEIDGSDDCTATIIEQIPVRAGEKILEEGENTYDEVAQLVAEYDFHRDRIKEVNEEMQRYKDEVKSSKLRQSEIKNRLAAIAGENEIVEGEEFRVKISRSVKGTGFDADKFRIEDPDGWLRYQKKGRDSERVTITRRTE